MRKITLIIKILIIRKALRWLAQILKEENITYGGLGNMGVEDFSYYEKHKEFSIVIHE